jgi:hypothetical protein
LCSWSARNTFSLAIPSWKRRLSSSTSLRYLFALAADVWRDRRSSRTIPFSSLEPERTMSSGPMSLPDSALVDCGLTRWTARLTRKIASGAREAGEGRHVSSSCLFLHRGYRVERPVGESAIVRPAAGVALPSGLRADEPAALLVGELPLPPTTNHM